MGPAYRYGEPSPHPYPPYYWAPPDIARPQPISAPWPEPYYCYRDSPGNYYWPPHDWGFNYGGGPYWRCPPEYEFSRPKVSNYEGDGRCFRPYTYVPLPSSFVYTRPFNPSEQFRHPDDYPMRFVPATGYDRFGPYAPQQHCCGCPNHVLYPKPVERISHEPVHEKRIKDSKDIDGKDFKGIDDQWMTDASGKKRSDNLQELSEPIFWTPGSLSDRNAEKHPVYWNPWNRKFTEDGRERPCPGYCVPLDSNTGSCDLKKEDENVKLPPFPIFWIPTKFKGEGDSKVENPPQETKKTDGGEADKVKEGNYCKPAEQKKETVPAREIPVKQLEEEEKPSQAQKVEERVSKVSDNNHVKKASSPRASKFPPVCLRVDPLPKKKTNGTSSSRSPSPPRKVEEIKDKVAVKAEENANSSASKVEAEQQSNTQSKEAEVKKKTEIGRDQAALRIQAVYRGYQVRKFQSLRKLREIMKIRGRIEELRQQISSSEFAGELSRDSKARGRINETLMGLLLQLDTIQGLHPVVRDVRKSVARELITMQEKLDTLAEQACANRLQDASREIEESDKIAAAEKTEEPITTSEVKEISGNILLKTSDNQQIESDRATNGENVDNKGSIEEVFEVENKVSKDGEDVEENSLVQQDLLQVKNATIDGDDLEEKVPVKHKSCLSATIKDGKYEEGTVNQDNNGTEEKKLMVLPTDIINDNITAEEMDESGFSNVRSDVENLLDSTPLKEEDVNEKSSATLGQERGLVDIDNEELLGSALPGEGDAANEKLSSATLEKEQAIVDIENENPIDSTLPMKYVGSEKLLSVTVKQEQAVEDIENEKLLDLALPKEEAVVNERLSSVTLEQEQAIEDTENVDALEKPTMGGQDDSIVTAPEAEVDQEKIAEKCAAPVADRNEIGRDISRSLAKEIEVYHDNDEMEFTFEVPSKRISHAGEETNLARIEKTLPSNENAEGEEEPPAAAETQSIGKAVEIVNTLEADLNVQNEEDVAAKEELLLPALKQPVEGKDSTLSAEILQETESGMADMENKPSIESKSLADNKVEDAYVVNTNEAESKILHCEGKQDREKWKEENEKLRKMVEKLMLAGERQMSTIVRLNDKIKQLENYLSQGKVKRKVRAGQLKLKSNVTNRKHSRALGT